MTDLLTRGIANIIPNIKELEHALSSRQKLNIYMGIDPTATRIHLGHAVPLRKLQEFARGGHNVTFLIGDFTALIGDTSDKDTERPVLTSEEIEKNFQTYKEQAGKILDFSLVRVVHNSEWLSKLAFTEIVKLCQRFSFGDFASRELIKKRLTDGKHVGLHEALYPVMQGYDSYHLDTDVQIGGADQTFNMQAGRILQEDLRGKNTFVIATKYLTGTDGRKMSKSWGNAIWLDDTPQDMYRKIMAIDDSLIVEYLTLATNMNDTEIEKIEKKLTNGENPMDIKKLLAQKIVTELHSKDEARIGQEEFERVVQFREAPNDIPEFKITKGKIIEDVLIESELVSSKTEIKRLIEQGGIEISGNKLTFESLKQNAIADTIIKIGKHKFLKMIE
jgi:tyrosyl-tRNA synthetase